jgi:anti-sigma regulatory factor (Ser/Thr protein kinase)
MIIRVSDSSHTGEARRHAATYSEHLKFDERPRGALAIVVTEIVTNLVKHAGTGTLVLEPVGHNGDKGVRVLALDKGSGIKDLNAALRDGHSTAGTPGNGLGAIQRLSDVFDIYSVPGAGTAVLAEVWTSKKALEHRSALDVAAISIPIKGEDVCGDGWGVKQTADATLLMVVDGLGHGIMAAEAAREAERIFAESRTDSPSPILQDSHDSLKKTRGAAMAIASLNLERGVMSFAGVGNIGASIVAPTASRGMASHNGTVGHQLHKMQEFNFPWTPQSLLVMHSDGLNTRWDLRPYAGIWSKHPALIAGLLYRDFSRERDDVTVLVAKNRAEGSPSCT